MVQLVGVGLIGLLLWYAYRALKRQMLSVDEEMRKQHEDRPSSKEISRLEKGEDGVYRVRKEESRDAD